MTPHEVATRLEHFAGLVRGIRGISRVNPHIFAEDKDAVVKAMMAEARELRCPPPAPRPPVASIGTGARVVDGRIVRVERRRRA